MAILLRPAVLIVEDEALVRLDLIDTLEAAGFTTFDATNAQNAILLLEANPNIAWLFTDVQLGDGMDGIDLARYVLARWPAVIISIGSGTRPDHRRLPAGVPFLPKPYDQTLLEQHITRCHRQLSDDT
jgi:two-component system, response regulator PdtaR